MQPTGRVGPGSAVDARALVLLERSPGAAGGALLEPHREVGGGASEKEEDMIMPRSVGHATPPQHVKGF